MYRIAYIDEDPADRLEFRRSIYGRFSAVDFHPEPDLRSMVDALLEEAPDALIVDYRLMEKDPRVHYNGVQLCDAFEARRAFIPCFVVTNFEGDAVDAAPDVNKVYSKTAFSAVADGATVSFWDRVQTQIDHCLAHLNSTKQEFVNLLAMRDTRPLTAQEEERLVFLDKQIELSADASGSIAGQLKSDDHLKTLEALLHSAKDLLQRYQK